MGWRLRRCDPQSIFLVTVRCFQGRLLVRPSAETNDILGGVLSRAVRRAGVELFAFSFASNHVHLLVRTPQGNLPEFMQYFLTNVSKKVGRLVGWRGSFWERRYSAEPILDEDALLERVQYVLSHGVKEGLVRSVREWPGLNSLPEMLGERARTFRWFNWTKRWVVRNGRRIPEPFDRTFAEQETLAVTPLPLERFALRSRWKRLLHRALNAIESQGRHEHRRVLGRTGVLAQEPQHRPDRPKRSRRPWCHTVSARLRSEFRDAYRAFRSAFAAASARWRLGDLSASLPEPAFKAFVRPLRPSLAAALAG